MSGQNGNSRTLFGTDGIRGLANQYPMDTGTAMALGRSLAWVLRTRGTARPKVLIGKDTRLSCYMLEHALASGLCSMGADVTLIGPMPTPGIAFLAHDMRTDAGIVISASHNPYQDNGIKFFDRHGFKLPDAEEAEIERWVREGVPAGSLATGTSVGRIRRVEDSEGRYIVHAKQTFDPSLTLDGMVVALDCANGAAYFVAPKVFAELGAEVFPIGITPNGTNINDGYGSLYPEKMQAEVLARKAQAGISLDGDADRVILVDERGEVVDGDQIMAICAIDLKERGLLRKNTVVATVMSNMGLEVALRQHGISLVRVPVGDRYVVEELRRGGYCFGGEQSGHMIFLDHATTGDGTICALQVLGVMKRTGKKLSELRGIMTPMPQILWNLKVKERVPLESDPAVSKAIRETEETLGENGRLLVRYSGTEALLRVMMEGPDAGRLNALLDRLGGTLKDRLGA